MENFVYNIVSKRRYKWLVTIIVLLSMVGAVMMLPSKLVLAKMLPGKSANTFTIYIDTATNASIEETQRVTTCIQRYMIKEKEVLNMGINLGQGAPLDYAGLVKGSAFKNMKNQAEIVINLTDKHERAEPSYMMVHRIRPEIQAECGGIVPHTSIRFIEMPSGPPTLATIVVELFGKDDKLLRDTIVRVADILKETEGLVDVDIVQDDIYTKYNLVPNKEKIIRAGLSVDQVNQITYLAFKGTAVAVKNTRDQQDQIPIFLRLSDETRTLKSDSINALQNKLSSLRLINRKGKMIPLSEVVSVESIRSSPSIFRKNLKNYVGITAECDMVSQVYPLLDARETMIEKLSDEFNVTKVAGINTYMFDLNLVDKESGAKMLLRWDGEMKVSLDTFRDLGGAFIAALILMFLLIVVYYKSFALSGIVLIGSFLSIIGVIVGHWITDKIQLAFSDINFFLTATSLIGFISLMGISARSSLLLIDFTKSLIEEGMEKKRAIAVATATRAKPIMLTAIAIILGSLLLATDPIFGGLGVALIFGSMAATLVSLFFIPILMDNARAMMPNDYEHPEEESSSYLIKAKEQVSAQWCVLVDNVKDYFRRHEDTGEKK
ncbi:MAG: Acriflavin resistance protein [uncultured Sulfurovum sp.]|uniref:Acriflavin resistance protein n=1 Tax=uncultured Sulfurovum sp. TaxID=269237 RepID=A0A6S6TVC4_9BACT|nr:MAG: Acriflavin resistance protein [uncultured Sulfurovum sp.]